MVIEKRGDRWCVLHGHPQKPGSKTDKPPGSVIKCFPTEKEATAMHQAIIISQQQGKDSFIITDLDAKTGRASVRVVGIQNYK